MLVLVAVLAPMWAACDDVGSETISTRVAADNLAANSAGVLAAIPSRFVFSYDGGASEILDGGQDMYDGGNRISTDLFDGPIDYTHGAVTDGRGLFSDGVVRHPGIVTTPPAYATFELPGLFVLIAELNGVDTFAIDGNLGADGGGAAEGDVIELYVDGTVYQGFLKRVFDTSDPSVNHLVIIERNDRARHTFETNTDNDNHIVTGLSGGTERLYYLLYAGENGLLITNLETEAIMVAFLTAIHSAAP